MFGKWDAGMDLQTHAPSFSSPRPPRNASVTGFPARADSWAPGPSAQAGRGTMSVRYRSSFLAQSQAGRPPQPGPRWGRGNKASPSLAPASQAASKEEQDRGRPACPLAARLVLGAKTSRGPAPCRIYAARKTRNRNPPRRQRVPPRISPETRFPTAKSLRRIENEPQRYIILLFEWKCRFHRRFFFTDPSARNCFPQSPLPGSPFCCLHFSTRGVKGPQNMHR